MANGDITYDNPGGNLVPSSFASGTFVGNGAATNILVGFEPSKIVVHNDTDDTEFTWVKGVPSGSVFQRIATGTKTLITGGMTVFEGDADESQGFTIPATSAINTAADVIYWEAYR